MGAARIETSTLPAGPTSQVWLFPAAPLYRNDDPQTSVDAGEAFAPTGTYSPLQRRILDAFHSQTWASRLDGTTPAGFTVDEITRYLADAYVWEHPPHAPTIGKRLTELRQSGDLCPSTDTRLSDRGRAMTVWHLP